MLYRNIFMQRKCCSGQTFFRYANMDDNASFHFVQCESLCDKEKPNFLLSNRNTQQRFSSMRMRNEALQNHLLQPLNIAHQRRSFKRNFSRKVYAIRAELFIHSDTFTIFLFIWRTNNIYFGVVFFAVFP